MEASGEGNSSLSMNTSSSAPFQEEKLGLGLYHGTCNNSNGDAHPFCLGLKFRQILLFFWGGGGGGVLKTGTIFLGYVKLRPQEHFFTGDCNVICRNYCVAIVMKICSTATPVHGVMATFADR